MNLQQILCNVKLKNNFIMFSVSLEYGALHSWGCKRITPLKATDPDDTHYLNKDGKLYVIDKEPFDQDNYCIENISTANSSTQVSYIQVPSLGVKNVHFQFQTRTFLCFDEIKYRKPARLDYYAYGLSISCIFLASTLIVYLSLPKVSMMIIAFWMYFHITNESITFPAVESSW